MSKRKIPTTRATAEGIGEVLETFNRRSALPTDGG